MKKKLFVILLAAALVLSVYGCSVTPSPTASTNPDTSSSTGTQTVPTTTEETLPWTNFGPKSYIMESDETQELEDDVAVQVLPETVENPDGLPVLKWVCMVDTLLYSGNNPMNESAVVELNQMLADRNLPYRVQFTVLSSSGWFVWPEEWFSHPNVQKELEDADLIFGYYTAREMEQWLLPITGHIYGDAQPALVGAMPHSLHWYSYEADGEIYGIPRITYPAYGQGWRVDAAFMEKYDLTAEDFNRNFWEMDELFAKIYEKNGNQPFLLDEFYGKSVGEIVDMNRTQYWWPMAYAFDDSTYQPACLYFAIDLLAEKPTVVNLVETDMFQKTYEAVLRYKEAGYLGNSSHEIYFDGLVDSAEPYLNTSENYYYIPCGPMGLSISSHAFMTGISAKTAHTEEALSLLEQIIIDDALRLQLCYGKEGRDYVLEDGAYTRVTQEDGSCYYMNYLSPQAAFFDFTTGKQREELVEAQRKNVSQATFAYCPIVFDYSVLDAELTAIGAVVGNYKAMYGYPPYYEEYYPRMLEELEEAGMSTVIEEMQRQLDAWIAEHPDWDPLERS